VSCSCDYSYSAYGRWDTVSKSTVFEAVFFFSVARTLLRRQLGSEIGGAVGAVGGGAGGVGGGGVRYAVMFTL